MLDSFDVFEDTYGSAPRSLKIANANAQAALKLVMIDKRIPSPSRTTGLAPIRARERFRHRSI